MMKTIKQLFLGAMFVLLAIWCAVMSGDTGSYLAGLSIILAGSGLLIFIIGFLKKDH